jgi:hypothetical protein
VRVGYPQKKILIPATRPAPYGLDKILPESAKNSSKSTRVGADRGGSGRVCGLGGFLPSPTHNIFYNIIFIFLTETS